MKISLTQISISDRVEAAKKDTRPSNTDTSTIPGEINPSPGDSTTAPIDASQINRAGSDVNQKAQEGNQATTDSARKTQSGEASKIQYENQQVSTDDQAPTAATKEELANTPPPKSKGFKESLIDSQMASMMGDKTGGDHPAPDRDYGHDNGDPNQYVKPQPESEPIRRNKMDPYNNSGNKVKEPDAFPIKSFDKENGMEPYKAPDQNFGPEYKQKTINQPKVPNPKIKFTSPRINTPRFN
jgi:hypothetical protein